MIASAARYSNAKGVPGVPGYPLLAVLDRLTAAVKSEPCRRIRHERRQGKWLDDRTLQLELEMLGNDDASIATFIFDGKTVSGRIETLVGFTAGFRSEAE
ncbi:hypothetical protein [Enhydrobacter sp.]|uniref:hypothetical protein n=1 Tax=Enhydrobacter sp. TaxID=1894999 RepID=UPI00260DBB25|nr:hypothetical protein [Enhydrobacter sp.]WIM11063.1 MAG: hypothetical protein OJF58_002020 [Enhydrobacter sp.]